MFTGASIVVPLPAVPSGVSGIVEWFGKSFQVWVERSPKVEYLIAYASAPRQDFAATWGANRISASCVQEYTAALDQPIQVRCLDDGIAKGRDGVRALVIADDKDDVGILFPVVILCRYRTAYDQGQ